MKTWLTYVNLSDEYERRARFIPALLSVLPLLPVSAAFGGPLGEWLKLVGLGVGISAVVAIGLSHLASACGNRLQERLWPDWPHDSPTHRWLHPDCGEVSNQQRSRRYAAIKDLVDLDIQAAVDSKDAGEIRAVIKDAVAELRPRLWSSSVGSRLHLHNIDYGFARNLTGLRGVWGTFALLSAGGCWVAYARFGRPLLWAVVSSVVLLAAVLLGRLLEGYVRRKAHYYGESFFAAVLALHEVTFGGIPKEATRPADKSVPTDPPDTSPPAPEKAANSSGSDGPPASPARGDAHEGSHL